MGMILLQTFVLMIYISYRLWFTDVCRALHKNVQSMCLQNCDNSRRYGLSLRVKNPSGKGIITLFFQISDLDGFLLRETLDYSALNET